MGRIHAVFGELETMQSFALLVASVLLLVGVHVEAAKKPAHLTLNPRCRSCGGGSSSAAGHLQSMGHQSTPIDGPDEVSVMPSPEKFYRDYIRQSRPLVIRGGISKQKYYNRWNDQYLTKKFGRTECLVEDQKKEERQSGSTDKLSLAKFLKRYNTTELFMVQDVYDHMLTDVQLPELLNCEEMWEGMNMVVMWMSSGGTKSVLHNDDQENLLTLVDGRKEVFLWEPTQASNLYVHEAIRGGISPVDQAAVDMETFPKFAQAKYMRAMLEPGDALYIPRKYWHQVNSQEGRNLAVNIWWFMGDKSKPFATPEGHADHFPGFVDQDGGYGRYKSKWPEQLACSRQWHADSMQSMEIKDEEYQGGMEEYLQTYRRRSTNPKSEL